MRTPPARLDLVEAARPLDHQIVPDVSAEQSSGECRPDGDVGDEVRAEPFLGLASDVVKALQRLDVAAGESDVLESIARVLATSPELSDGLRLREEFAALEGIYEAVIDRLNDDLAAANERLADQGFELSLVIEQRDAAEARAERAASELHAFPWRSGDVFAAETTDRIARSIESEVAAGSTVREAANKHVLFLVADRGAEHVRLTAARDAARSELARNWKRIRSAHEAEIDRVVAECQHLQEQLNRSEAARQHERNRAEAAIALAEEAIKQSETK